MTDILEVLVAKGACRASTKWVRQSSDRSAQGLWETCPRGDWMWWALRWFAMPTKEQSVAFARWCVAHATARDADAAVADTAAWAARAAAAAAADATAAYWTTVAAADVADAACNKEREQKVQADYIREHFTCPVI